LENIVEERKDPDCLVAIAHHYVVECDFRASLSDRLEVVDRSSEVAAVPFGDTLECVRLEFDILAPADVSEHGDDRPSGDVSKLDFSRRVPQATRHIVVLVR
jgi:hypothetical protein